MENVKVLTKGGDGGGHQEKTKADAPDVQRDGGQKNKTIMPRASVSLSPLSPLTPNPKPHPYPKIGGDNSESLMINSSFHSNLHVILSVTYNQKRYQSFCKSQNHYPLLNTSVRQRFHFSL